MALKDFQKDNNLTPDGKIGPKTMSVFQKKYSLTTEQTANFFGQVGHETGEFRYDQENLNYSAERLKEIFHKYFPTDELANSYARKPEKIANRVYANRMGNGGESSGDGWKYRGRGAIQLTGSNNYTDFSKYTNDPEVLSNPDVVASKYYLKSALFFFTKNKIFDIANNVNLDTIKKITKKINGGYNGLDHRHKLTVEYYNKLKNTNT